MKDWFVQHMWKFFGINRVLYQQKELQTKVDFIEKNQKELLKAVIFNDTIRDCEWLKYKSFSAGGWAIDYGCLYTLFRVLNDTHPQNILEFGLGQSSKLIHQYAYYFQDVQACTYEHDEKWVSFFLKSKAGNYPINLKMTELETIEYNGVKTLSYKNNCEELKGEKFDLIMIDAPFGSEHFSRSQILNLIPHSLSSEFCIIMDDYSREGEKETVKEIEKILSSNHIQYTTRMYDSSKQHFLICASTFDFLTTL